MNNSPCHSTKCGNAVGISTSAFVLAQVAAILIVCAAAVAFPSASDALDNAQYLDESLYYSGISFELPSRSVMLLPVVFIMIVFALTRAFRISDIPYLARLYGIFLLLMVPSFVFDHGAKITNNMGFLVMLTLMVVVSKLEIADYNKLLKLSAFLLMGVILTKNILFPPFEILLDRRYGGGQNPNYHAILAGTLVVLSALFLKGRMLDRVLFVLCLVLGVTNLFLTGSRGPLVALALAGLVVAKRKWLGLLIISAICVFAFWLYDTDFGEFRLQEFLRSDATALQDRWQGTFATPMVAWLDSSLLPIGPSVGDVLRRDYNSPLDNSYVWILLAGGVFPLVAYAVFVFAFMKRAVAFRRKATSLGRSDRSPIPIAFATYYFVMQSLEGSLKHVGSYVDVVFLLCIMMVTKSWLIDEKKDIYLSHHHRAEQRWRRGHAAQAPR